MKRETLSPNLDQPAKKAKTGNSYRCMICNQIFHDIDSVEKHCTGLGEKKFSSLVENYAFSSIKPALCTLCRFGLCSVDYANFQFMQFLDYAIFDYAVVRLCLFQILRFVVYAIWVMPCRLSLSQIFHFLAFSRICLFRSL